jgi:hypothetical protein
MKYVVKMGPVAMIDIPSFVKIGSVIQELMGGYINRESKVIT